MSDSKKKEIKRDFKYFYDVNGDFCERDDRNMIVASEKLIRKSKITGCAGDRFNRIFDLEIEIGDKIDIIFGDPRAANGLTKVSETEENPPISKKSGAYDFSVYEFEDGKQCILDEHSVYVRTR